MEEVAVGLVLLAALPNALAVVVGTTVPLGDAPSVRLPVALPETLAADEGAGVPLGDAPSVRLPVALPETLAADVSGGVPLGDAPNETLLVALSVARGGIPLRTDSMLRPRYVLLETAAASASQRTEVRTPLAMLLLGMNCVMLL